jgi:cytochrome c peroxidase
MLLLVRRGAIPLLLRRWFGELRDALKTWLSVTRTWATIVLALAVPAAMARAPAGTPEREYTIAQAQFRPEPYPKERREQFDREERRYYEAPQRRQEAPQRREPRLEPTPQLPPPRAWRQQETQQREEEPRGYPSPPEWRSDPPEPSYSREYLPPPQERREERYDTTQEDRRPGLPYPRTFERDREWQPERQRQRPPPPEPPLWPEQRERTQDPAPWVPERPIERPRQRAPVYQEPEGDLVSLGQQLFFDPQFSKSRNTSCASCHRPDRAWSDVGKTSRADDGKRGRRNAPSLINVGQLPVILWSGRLKSLEAQATEPWKRGEMGISLQEAEHRLREDPEYVALFRNVLGRAPSASGMAEALAAFQRTLVSDETRLERYLRGDPRALSPVERDGHLVFEHRAGCGSCHTVQASFRAGAPLQLSDYRYHNTGVGWRGRYTDTGRFEVTKRQSDMGAFRTPPLRNLTLTAPYMHDGSIPTLEAVVDFYDKGGADNPYQSRLIRPLHLSAYDKHALVAFLRTLDDPVRTVHRCRPPACGHTGQPRRSWVEPQAYRPKVYSWKVLREAKPKPRYIEPAVYRPARHYEKPLFYEPGITPFARGFSEVERGLNALFAPR